jgi:succinate-acetate transporter protein
MTAVPAPRLANPAPLGLVGFGLTTMLLNIHNAGFYPVASMILGMGLFVGGIAQLIAGILEFRTGNTFGFTAFCAYGSFWLSLVAMWVLPKLGWAEPTPVGFVGWYLALWGVFTFFMFLGTLRKNRALQVIFGSLVVLFFLLAIRDWTGNEAIGTLAGYEGIFCGASAFYLAMAEILNETYGHEVLPIGAPAPAAPAAPAGHAVTA